MKGFRWGLFVPAFLYGCLPAGTFSHAPLPSSSRAEEARTERWTGSVSEADLARYLKASFYRLWIADYGLDVSPPTVVAPINKGAPTIDGVALAMADGEGQVSALHVLQVGPQQLAPYATASGPLVAQQVTALVESYRQPLQQRLNNVGGRVARVAGRSDISFALDPGLGLNAGTPNVLQSRAVFVGPQMVLLAESDDELAAVLGHEVAHITQGHTTVGAIRNGVIATLQLAAMVAVAAADASQRTQPATPAEARNLQQAMVGAAALTGLAAQGTVNASGYTQDNERDADFYGLQYASAAGYDALGGVDFFTKLQKIARGTGQENTIPFLTDHPGDAERLVRITKAAGRLRGGGEVLDARLNCWVAPAGDQRCQTCCATTSRCLTECR